MVDSTVGAEIRRGKDLQNKKKKLNNSQVANSKSYIYNNDGSNSIKSTTYRKPLTHSQKMRESIQRLAQPVKRHYPQLASNINKVSTASQKTIEKRKSITQRSSLGFSVAECSDSFRNVTSKGQTKKNVVKILRKNKKNIDTAHKNHRTRKKIQNEGKKNEKEATYARSFCIMFAHRIAEELLPSYEVNLFGRLKYLSAVLKEEICNMTADERNPKKDSNLESIRKSIVEEIANRTAIWINGVMEEAFSKLAEEELRAEMNKLFCAPCLGSDVRSTQQQWHKGCYHLDLEEQVGPVLEFLDDLIDNVDIQLPAEENKSPGNKHKIITRESVMNTSNDNIPEANHQVEDIEVEDEPIQVLGEVENDVHEVSDESFRNVVNYDTEVANKLEHDLVREVGFEIKEPEVDVEQKDVMNEVDGKVEDIVVDVTTNESDSDHSMERELNENILPDNEEKFEYRDVGSLAELIDGIVSAEFEIETNLSDSETKPDEDTKKDNVIHFIDEVMNNLGKYEDSQVQSEASSEDVTFGIESDIDSKHEVRDFASTNLYEDPVETWRAEIQDNTSREIPGVGSQSSDLSRHLDKVDLDMEKKHSDNIHKVADTKSALRHLKNVASEQQDYVEISDFDLKKITNFPEVANAINQISSIHETVHAENNVQSALEEKLFKLIDEWCPENMDESMGQTINYVSGEVASWLVEKQMNNETDEKLQKGNFIQNMSSSNHSMNSGISTHTGTSDESNAERGHSLVEDIQIPFRDSTPSTEEIRVFQSAYSKSSSSLANEFRESDSVSSKSSIVTLKLDLTPDKEPAPVPRVQDLLAKEITRDITEELYRKNINETNDDNSHTSISSQGSFPLINFKVEATNHGDTREFTLNQATSHESTDVWQSNRHVLAHILPDILGVSEPKIDSERVLEENNYESYRVPSASRSCLYTAKVECDPCQCNDGERILGFFTAPAPGSSRNEFPSTMRVVIRDWNQVLKMFSLDMLCWSQWIASVSGQALGATSREHTVFHKPVDYFNVANRHDWMKFRELVEEEAARRRKQKQFSNNDKCWPSQRDSTIMTCSQQNSYPKAAVNLPKCSKPDKTMNINRNDDKYNQWINGKVLEHLLENKSKTTMGVADWKELRRSLKSDEQKWSQYRKRAERK